MRIRLAALVLTIVVTGLGAAALAQPPQTPADASAFSRYTQQPEVAAFLDAMAKASNSSLVLWGQTLAYTLYALAIMAVVAWFAVRVTRGGGGRGVASAVFYSFVGFLVVCGVSLHIITYNTIPWAPLDLNRAAVTPDRTFAISVAEHRFTLPSPRLQAACGEKVLFTVTSRDLTYGFGLFRQDNSMVFQMQVVPGHVNDILWVFDRPGVYTIRSTEYSGPAGTAMIERDAVEITCADGSAN